MGVAVGDVQFTAAVGEGLALLPGVPLFVGDPAGGDRAEAQVGGVRIRASGPGCRACAGMTGGDFPATVENTGFPPARE